MGDGAGAKAGFVGEDAAGNALLHADKQAADGAAGEGRRVEGAGKNSFQHQRETWEIQHHNAHRQHDVKQRHKGHEALAYAANALDAAQQHHGDQHGHHDADHKVQCGERTIADNVVLQQGGIDGRHNADDQVDGCHSFIAHNGILVQGGINGGDNGVDLRGVAGAEHRQHAEQRVQHSQKLPVLAQAVFNIVHRAADPLARGVALTEMDGQRDLGKLGAHAQQCRSADGDGTRHTCNVAGAYGARQRSTYRLERRHSAVRGILFAEHAADSGFDDIRKFADLQKACPHAEQQPHANDAHHGRDTPDKVVDCLVDSRNRF